MTLSPENSRLQRALSLLAGGVLLGAVACWACGCSSTWAKLDEPAPPMTTKGAWLSAGLITAGVAIGGMSGEGVAFVGVSAAIVAATITYENDHHATTSARLAYRGQLQARYGSAPWPTPDRTDYEQMLTVARLRLPTTATIAQRVAKALDCFDEQLPDATETETIVARAALFVIATGNAPEGETP